MPRPQSVPFGTHFQRWRNERGVTAERMAKLLGVHPRAIARLDQTQKDTDETRQIESKLRELQQSASEPASPRRQQVRELWEQQLQLETHHAR